MKKILLIVASLVLLPAVIAFADCTNGKTAITIVNPAGKVIEICVPDAAIPGLQTASDNSGTIIPAICPCFTQEDVEAAFNTDQTLTCDDLGEGLSHPSNLPCLWITCVNSDKSIYIDVVTGTEDEGCYTIAERPVMRTKYSTLCGIYDEWLIITNEESKACYAIIETFLQ